MPAALLNMYRGESAELVVLILSNENLDGDQQTRL